MYIHGLVHVCMHLDFVKSFRALSAKMSTGFGAERGPLLRGVMPLPCFLIVSRYPSSYCKQAQRSYTGMGMHATGGLAKDAVGYHGRVDRADRVPLFVNILGGTKAELSLSKGCGAIRLRYVATECPVTQKQPTAAVVLAVRSRHVHTSRSRLC